MSKLSKNQLERLAFKESVKAKLIARFKEKYPNKPFTIFVTEWNDKDFKVTLSSSIFLDGEQHEQVRLPKYRVLHYTLEWYHGKIKETANEREMQNKRFVN